MGGKNRDRRRVGEQRRRRKESRGRLERSRCKRICGKNNLGINTKWGEGRDPRFDSVAASAGAELRKLGSNLAKESGLEERDVLRILFQQLERRLEKGSAAMDDSQP